MGSHTKPKASNLSIWSGDRLSFLFLWWLTQFPILKSSSLCPCLTRQLPSLSWNTSNNPNQNSQDAVLASTRTVLRALENSTSTDEGMSNISLSLMKERLSKARLAMFVRYWSSVSAKLLSCALRAFTTSQTGLKLLASIDASGSSPASIKTGITIVPLVWTFAPLTFLMALPTACITSTWLPFGSMKATPSSEGTSTPSAKHLALVSRPLS